MSLAVEHQVELLSNEEECWQAVMAKDARFDGRFVVAVSSTRIYCRPSCPARRPRRERVTFFRLPEAAEEAGYRACRRCHPRLVTQINPQVKMVQRACRFLEQHQEETISLDQLGRHLGRSSFHVQRTFKSVMGVSPRQYAQACRTNSFKASVRAGESISGAMYGAGFGSSSRLYSQAKAELGMTPAVYSRGGHAARICYTVSKCELGYLLVAATDKGICAVKLGDTAAALETDLRGEYSAARIERDEGSLADAVGELLNHLAGRQPQLNLPLDIRATAFQRLVWEALREIPRGATRSYSEVAEQIGRPRAARAVARACATNPVALVIPCHRVVCEDKTMGGYRWGIERKKELLEKERTTS